MTAELSKRIEALYSGRFGIIAHQHQFLVSNRIFSQNNVLDCLESELKSAREIRLFAAKKILNSRIDKILVLGPGSGRMSSELRAQWPKSILYELDINQKVIDRLKQKHRFDTLRKPLVGSVDNIPKDIYGVDLVVAYSVLRYVKKPLLAIKEINRVLNPFGQAIIGEGKMAQLIKDINQLAVDLQIKTTSFEIKGVQLPRLTYFYWLLASYRQSDPEVVNLVDAYLKSQSKPNLIKSIFALAGSSYDSIYGFYWRKK